MYVRDLMTTRVAKVKPTARVQELARSMVDAGDTCALVVGDGDKLVGLVTTLDLRRLLADVADPSDVMASEIMKPANRLGTVSPEDEIAVAADLFHAHGGTHLPVVDNGRALGILTSEAASRSAWHRPAISGERRGWEEKAATILKSLHEGLVVVDRNLIIREYNGAAERLAGMKAVDRIGKRAEFVSTARSPVLEVMETGEAQYGVESLLQDGRTFLANYVPILEDGEVAGVIQTFSDITDQKRLQRQVVQTKEELDKAFALTLPNSRVELKLKTTPEYRDDYEVETGRIRITEVLPDGNYLHVVNALKVAADLNEKGVFNLIGLNKDDLVQAIIFHDLGKSQPTLEIGAVVDPKKVFEDGRLHAARSADIAQHFYHKGPDVTWLIRYHHHLESQLPDEFPTCLLPMFRLFQVIDGLSACLTRRNGLIELTRDGTRITISERNNHPDYNRRWEINLLTGERRVIETYRLERSPGQLRLGGGQRHG
ncbi:MAG: CBS domain-containing protein [Bacillota bacterium]